MERHGRLRDTRGVVRKEELPASRTRTLSDDEAAVGARWERTTGTKIGRYVVEARLGAGAMGVVYRALDPKLNRLVAIKMAHDSQARTPRGVERFAREARAMAALDHPHVVAVYDYGVRDGDGFLVMELLVAKTLTEWLETGPTSADRIRVLREAGEGLAAAHEAGLVHRDFKPGNVLITQDGTAKVTDFGLARVYGEDDSRSDASPVVAPHEFSGSGPNSHTVTAEGVVLGTPAYMSPEQHRAHPLTPQSDQYSYCLTAFEVLTGSRLFEAPSLMKLELMKDEGPSPQALRGLSLPIARALRRGLQPRARDRFVDVPALLRALERRPLRTWAAAAGAVLLPLALVAAPSGGASDPSCTTQSTAPLWTDEDRGEMRAVFNRSADPGAGEVADLVLSIFEGEAEAWSLARAGTCELGPKERDLAVACLETRREEFEATRDRISMRSAVAVQQATQVASSLKPSAECLQPIAARLQAARGDPRTHAYLDEVERRKNAASDALRREDNRAAQAELAAALEAIGQLEPPAIRAKPLTDVGNLLDSAGAAEKASEVLGEAHAYAVEAGDDRNAASAAIRLVWVEGVALGRPEDGRRWSRKADAHLEHFTPRPDMAAARFVNLAAIAQGEGDLEQALKLMMQANEAAESGEQAPASPARQNTLLMARARREHNVGALNYWLNRNQEGLAAFQREVAAIQAARGVDHLDTLDGLEGVAVTADALGDLGLARVSAKSRVRILEKHRGKNHPSVGGALQTLASIEYSLGDLEEVRRLYERTIALLQDHEEPGYELRLASARVELTTVLRELGEGEAAMEQATLAYAGFEAGTDPAYAGHRAGALRELALLHSQLGKHDEAIEYMERAYVAGGDSMLELLNRVVFAVAQIYVFNGAGRYDDAVAAGEAAMKIGKDMPNSVDTMLLQLRLAEALAHRGAAGDNDRALGILDSVETKARQNDASVILKRDLPESRAEVVALGETR